MKPKSMVPGSKNQQGSWSWLDRVQNKLESLYETEQAGTVFFQETGRILENQVTKVGANVKRFYSDFVRELLLPLEGPQDNQAWADESTRGKAPGTKKAPRGSQPGGESEEAQGQEAPRGDLGEEHEQEKNVRVQSDEKDASDMSGSDFELLQPPLFQAPQVEETHEDLRVKEGVTKLHLKLQEMERIEADKGPQAPVVEAIDGPKEATEERALEATAPTVLQAVERQTDGPDVVPNGATNLADTPESTTAMVAAPRDGPDALSNKMLRHVASDAELSRAESDAVDLEFASEAEGESKRGEEDFMSGNESDRSERAKWYGAKVDLTRKESGESTKGGWFDWELV